MVSKTPVARPAWREWLDDYLLVVLAVLTWVLLISAAALDHLTDLPHTLIQAMYVAAYLSGGTLATRKALSDLWHHHVNVDLLMVVAAIGAAIVDSWAEGAVLLALFASSNALEHFAMERTRDAVRALMALMPESVTVIRDNVEELIPLEEVRIGDVVLVRPGERIAVDGVVLSGRSEIDESTITGESIPVTADAGASVFAGTVNLAGALQIEASTLPEDTTLARIVRVVSDAREKQGRAQRFAEAFEGKYAIGVLVFAAMLFLGGWLWRDAQPGDAFYRAMTVLVVMSPCALVISTPASTLSGLANAARHGVLFKGGAHLETAGSIDIFAFDKTGTLTAGIQTVTDVLVLAPEMTEDRLLVLAASVERLSEHHIAAAVMRCATERGLSTVEVSDFDALPGRGVTARVNGDVITIGNQRLLGAPESMLDAIGAEGAALLSSGKTVVFVMNGHQVLGLIAVADVVRAEAAQTVDRLRGIGIKRIVMITGDNAYVAESIARQVGITEVRADVLPEEKMQVIEDLRGRGGLVAMVGDGVNDAPALATADLGIAMGGKGTDVALETADMVLIRDDLSGIAYAMELSRRTRRTIVQNLTFSLSVIAVLTILALTIGIPLPLGVVGHEGSTVIVVLNGLRLLGWTPPESKIGEPIEARLPATA